MCCLVYQFKTSHSVIEIRENLQKMVNRGYLSQDKMIKIVKEFGEQKAKAPKEQRFIVIM